MPISRQILCSVLAGAIVILLQPIAAGQITPPRMRFPTPIGTSVSASGVQPPVAVQPPPPIVTQPTAPAFGGSRTTLQPPATVPPALTTTPPATLNGTIAPAVPATPGFDPYADPTLSVQPTVPGAPSVPYVGDPYSTPPPGGTTYQPLYSTAPFGAWPRFLQQMRLRYTWILGGDGPKDLGWNSFELTGTFLVPFLFNQNAPLLITPGFALHLLDGPGVNVAPAPFAVGADLPPRLFDGFVDVAWTPQITYGLSADLGFRVGAYSDFSKIDNDAIRYLGRGFGVWRTSDAAEWRAGVVYLDRLGIKLLPAGGLIWTPGGPQGNVRWEILFPNPKLAWRLNSWRNADIWWYVAGEFGGGSWAIDRVAARVPPVGTTRDQFDYNDYRVLVGLESRSHYGLKGLIECGYVFAREVDYRTNNLDFRPDSTFLLRAGLTY